MIGTTLSQYRITAALGAGGMGEVWRADDEKLGREVALKVLPADVAEDPERLARFEREAKVLASLNHPNIAHLYGLETAQPCHPERSGLRGRGVEGSPEAQSDVEKTTTSQPSGDPSTRPSDDLAQGDMNLGASSYSSDADTESRPQDLKTSRPVTFLVMELVEGEDLSERIARGPIPIDEAVPIALQIAEALEAAHEAGIVHRDLKPANIKLKADGTVKVLDFGLAKAWEAEAGDSRLSLSPTMTQHATAAGVILGTAAYMSPEQARGKAVDRRTDVWAFGVVLWEMLTGVKLFDGETVSDLMAAVLTREPDLEKLPPKTPSSVKRLVRRCLERDPGRRLQWLGDARLELVDAEGGPQDAPAPAERSTARRLLPWVMAAMMAAVAVAVGLWDSIGAAPELRQVRFTVPAPEGTVFHLEGLAPGPVVLSPDGRRMAFTVRGVGGVIHLAVRDLDSVETRYLEEAEGAQYPFWSPDGTEIGFFTRSGAALRVIPADGGPVRTLCASRNGKGGSWNRDGVIIFTDDSNTPISAISADGGVPRVLTTIDREAGENSHRHPQFLPDGQRFLYLARNVGGPDTHIVKIGFLDGSTDVEILRAPVAAAYIDGQLLYLRGRTLVSRFFDTDSLELSGDELELVDDVMVIEGAARGVFSATEEVLVFQQGEEHTLGELVWLDRSGAKIGRVGDVASYFSLAVSPDGSKVAVPVSSQTVGTNDLWICDVQRGLRSRVTFDDGEDLSPVWSSDGRQVYFVSNRSGDLEVYRLTPGTTGEPELIVGGDRPMTPTSESPDGSRLLLTRESETAGSDLVILDLERGGDPQPFRGTRFNEDHATFSPDGRWVAYASDESGRFEIYLTPSTADGRHWQVSTEGGLWPRWIAATGEILYQDTSGRFVVVSVRTGDDTIEIGDPEVLFGGYAATRLYQLFDPAPDGSKLLYRALSNEDPPEPPIVVVNWQGQGDPS